MKIMVLGGDGFCGWPTALHLAKHGHEVLIVDNLYRRQIDNELGIESLTPIQPLAVRVARARELGLKIYWEQSPVSLTNNGFMADVLSGFKPEVVVHFAEIRSAPYSMKSSVHRSETVANNMAVTHNLLSTIVDLGLDTHIVHLGTMGVYGYSTSPMVLPDGYLPITMHGKDPNTGAPTDAIVERALYPSNPGSVYHMTKVMDHTMFQFYAKNWKLRITDLHQGIVYGVETEETKLHSDLVNRFDYDSAYGTVLNRFLVQAVVGHPLTVYGTGGQTRAFIHIKDTVQCVRLACENVAPSDGLVRTMNQVSETHNVLELATQVNRLFGTEIKCIPNPRKEAAENLLFVTNEGLINLGFKPTLMKDELLNEVVTYVQPNLNRIMKSAILPTEIW